jgi:tetratricopeptide (TPR) repeat protein
MRILILSFIVLSCSFLFGQIAQEWFFKGVASADLEENQEAITNNTKFTKDDSIKMIASSYNSRGMLKSNLEDYEAAIADYNLAIELFPSNAPFYYNRGKAKYNLKDYRGALADHNKAIELDSKTYPTFYYNRGRAKYDLKDYSGALADYNKAIELDSKYAPAYYSRGFVKYNFGDKNGGCLDWSKAGELGKGDAYDLIKKYCN